MKLSPDEERFLHRWIYDEARYEQDPGPAKRMQLEQHATPADLSAIIAASIPNPAEQETLALGLPPEEPLSWPWPGNELRERVEQARHTLDLRQNRASQTSQSQDA
jgi:hypothetical protein